MSKFVVKTCNFIISSRRLLRHAKRPTRKEISITTKMSLIGILIIGAVGFVLHLLFSTLMSAIS